VDPASHAMLTGDSAISTYTVSVDKVDCTDTNWAVAGTITVTNPHAHESMTVDVSDGSSFDPQVPARTRLAPVAVTSKLSMPLTLVEDRETPDVTSPFARMQIVGRVARNEWVAP
jgi:hypothetical protein